MNGPRRRIRTLAVAALCAVGAMGVVVAQAIIAPKSYYVSATILVALALIPWLFDYERQRPGPRTVALMAATCALVVVSRMMFAAVPFFKPTCALLIIAALAFGGRFGFLAGAISLLLSNFMFGQGPWTPWQMLAFGIAGACFGILGQVHPALQKGLTRRQLAALCVGGFAFYVLIVGVILDTCSALTMSSELSGGMLLAIYAAGLGPNVMQGAATALCLAVLTNPLLRLLARVRTKYLD